MSFAEGVLGQTYRRVAAEVSPERIDPWSVPVLATGLLVTLFWVAPLAYFVTDLPLLALAGLTLIGYLLAIASLDRPIEGVIAGILGLATCAASIPLVYAETSRANLRLHLADPFVGLLLLLGAYWLVRGRMDRPPGTLVVLLAVLWTAWAALAAVFGAGPSPSTAALFAINQSRWVFYLLAGLMLAALIPLRVGVVTVAIAGAIQTPIAIAQSLIVGPLGLEVLGSSAREDPITMLFVGRTVETGYPISGFAGNATALATITLLSLAVCLFYLARGAIWQRLLAGLSLPFIALSQLLAGSDTVIVALAVVSVGTLVALSWHRVPVNVRNAAVAYRPWLLGMGAATLSALAIAVWRIGVARLFAYVPLVDGDGFATRVEKYQAALDIAREYPLFGLGGANFELVAGEYIDGPVNAIHSTPFEFLAGTGIVGLLVYLVLLAAVAWDVLRVIDSPTADHPIVLVVCVWAVGFALLSALNLIWPAHTSNAVFWILAGLTIASRDDDNPQIR